MKKEAHFYDLFIQEYQMLKLLIFFLLCINSISVFAVRTALLNPPKQIVSDSPPPNKPLDNNTQPWWDGLTGTLALTSNYVFRGVSESENLPAIQGGLTYTFPIGLYFNVWGSNAKFPDTDASVEMDTTVGVTNTIKDLSFDLNLARYNYPGASELDYVEFNSVYNYLFLQAGLSYSANAYNTHQSGTYYSGGINYEVPAKYAFGWDGFNFLALMGHYSLPRAADNSYNDYNVAITKQLNKTYSLTAQWTATNGRQHIPPYDSDHLIATLTAYF